MPRRKRIHDEEILNQVRALFLEHGLHITTRDLAREIGISEGVLFQRFGSKDGLIRAALSTPEIHAVPLVEAQARKGNDARETLENIAVTIFSAFRELLPLYIPLLAHPDPDKKRALTSRGSPFQLFLDALERHLKAERHAGRIQTESPYTTAYFIVSALHHAAFFETITGRSSEISEGTARDLIRAVWSGLQPIDKK